MKGPFVYRYRCSECGYRVGHSAGIHGGTCPECGKYNNRYQWDTETSRWRVRWFPWPRVEWETREEASDAN